jgi:6-phosphogluconolactonase (cycloisomerase 2 family)
MRFLRKMTARLTIRMIVAIAAVLPFALVPELALAQTPGALTQLGNGNSCVEFGTSAGCPTTGINGLNGSQDVAVSPKGGENVYAIGSQDDAIAEFARNADGHLTEIGCIADATNSGSTTCGAADATAHGLINPRAIVISPDGKNVYVAAQDQPGNGTIAEFARAADGTLSQLSQHDCIAENNEGSQCADNNAYGIAAPINALAISPDGTTVYAADSSREDVAWFTRAGDGSLSQAATNQCIQNAGFDSSECNSTASGLGNVDTAAVSSDGSTVYTGSTGNNAIGTVSWLAVGDNGSLSQGDCIQEQADTGSVCSTTTGQGISDVTSVAISPDGLNVYATSAGPTGDIAEFKVLTGGALMQLNGNDCIQEATNSGECDNTQGTGLDGALSVKVSPDGNNVYVASTQDDCCDAAVAEFARSAVDGSLTQLPSPDDCLDAGADDCQNEAVGIGGGALAISPDGNNLYLTGIDDDVAEFARGTRTLTVSLAGSGSGGVSDGTGGIACPTGCSNAYTTDTLVTLSATPGSGSTFTGWSGACSGTGACRVTMNDDLSVTATFTSTATSAPGSPTPVLTGAPSAVTDGGAGFSGSVNPDGLATTAYFQYGLDKKYSQVGASGPNYTAQTQPQTVGSDFTTHGVGPATVTGLVPNALYHVRLVATNSAGTTFGQDVTFTTAAAPAPGSPTLGQTFNIKPVSGLVLVDINGHLVPLTELTQIPSGVPIDTLHGTLELITATGDGGGGAHDAAAKTQHGEFSGAVFRLSQQTRGAGKGLVTLMLALSAFKGAPSQSICKSHGTAADATAASSRTIQLLHASAHGKFRTSGRYSAATVLGTIWTVSARCDGTLTHAIKDEVSVTDFVRHKTIILHAGQSYLAPGRAKHG